MKRCTSVYRWTKHMSRLCLRGNGAIAAEIHKADRILKPSVRPAAPFVANKKGMRWRANSKTGVAECVSRYAR